MSQIDLGQVAATVAAGTVTKGSYNSAATVTNSGTPQNAVFDFTIPTAVYPVVNQTASSVSINPGVLNLWGTVSALTITLATPSDSSIMNEYLIQFTSGSTATTLTVPASVMWAEEPEIEANATYQVSIVNNLGIIVRFT
jgi:hypothetical protein